MQSSVLGIGEWTVWRVEDGRHVNLCPVGASSLAEESRCSHGTHNELSTNPGECQRRQGSGGVRRSSSVPRVVRELWGSVDP